MVVFFFVLIMDCVLISMLGKRQRDFEKPGVSFFLTRSVLRRKIGTFVLSPSGGILGIHFQ